MEINNFTLTLVDTLFVPLAWFFVGIAFCYLIVHLMKIYIFFNKNHFHDIKKKRNTTLSNDYLEGLEVYEDYYKNLRSARAVSFSKNDMPSRKEYHNDFIPLVVTSVVVADHVSDSSSNTCNSSSSNDCGGFE